MTAINFLGRPIQWKWEMSKINPPMAVSLQEAAMARSAKFFGYPCGARSYWYDHGDIYFDEEEVRVVEEFIAYLIDRQPAYPDRIARKIYQLARRIDVRATKKEHETTDPLSLFRSDCELLVEMMSALAERGPAPIAHVMHRKLKAAVGYASARNGTPERVAEYLDTLSLPIRPSVFAEEKKLALTLSVGFDSQEKKEQDARIDAYCRRWDWLSFHWSVGEPMPVEEIRARFIASAPTASTELAALVLQEKEREDALRSAVRELSFGSRGKRILRQYREFLYLRTFVKDKINILCHAMIPCMRAIEQSAGIPHGSLPFLTIHEIEDIKDVSRSVLLEKIEARHGGFSAGIVEGTFRFGEFTHQDTERKTEPVSAAVRGSIAFRGKATGVVRVLTSPGEQDRVQQGDILVVGMTTPDYLPAMHRAAAFVTDEGGITCHAAIVARELRKPCIIGTKIATRVLIDGNFAEVDAERGEVRHV